MVKGKPILLKDVDKDTPYFVGPYAPTLHLDEDNEEIEHAVYLLRCKPQITGGAFTWYVGLAPVCKLAVRMKQHLAGTASDFTAKNEPRFLEALYPAARKSVEAYAFFSMMESLPVEALNYGRLGGWTQTRPTPSQTSHLFLREQKRMLSDSCLACGKKDHFVKNHPKEQWPDSVPLHCDNCHATIDLTALGRTRTRPPAPKRGRADTPDRPSSPPPPPKAARIVAPAGATARRHTTTNVLVDAALVARQPREYAKVLICQHEYTTMTWYFGKRVGDKSRSNVYNKCHSNALELRNGDAKTLVDYGWAKTQRPKELLPGRTNLPADWLDTAVKAARPPHKPLQVQKGCDGRNVLLRVDDLVKHFP